jgi:hypothetical protein
MKGMGMTFLVGAPLDLAWISAFYHYFSIPPVENSVFYLLKRGE